MRTLVRILAGSALLLVVAIVNASAQGGINLGWNDCGAAGASLKTFACDTNTLTGAVLYASAVPPLQMDQLLGQESELILQENQPSLSPWWHFETGGCRAGLINAGFDFVSGPSTCQNPWLGGASGGMAYEVNYGAPNRARLRTICAIPGSTIATPDNEYYLFKVTLLGAKTTGVGSCAGCMDEMTIVFTQVKLVQPLGVGDYIVTQPIVRQAVTWRGNAPVATRSITWGSVKSMYR